MKRRGRSIILFSLIISLSPLIPQDTPDSSYYPLGMGYQWNYGNPYSPHAEKIVDTTSINSLLYYGLAMWGEQVNYWLRGDNSAIYLMNEQDSSEFLLFSFDADTGDSRELPPGYECSFGSRITLTSKQDTVITSSDKFFNCYHFEHQPYCDDAGIYDTWFAKGVGKVRYFEDNIGGMMEYVLESYTFTGLTTYDEQSWINDPYQLRQTYPNPFNPATIIEFSIPRSGFVTLTVYDLVGREVQMIFNQHMDAGHHKVKWNASEVSSGIYFVRMQVRDPSQSSGHVFTKMRKVTVLR